MGDCKQLERLIEGGYNCVSIVTHEELYALEIARTAALNLNRPVWMWSMGRGVREGMLSGSCSVAETELPAPGLRNLMETEPGSVCITLDLAEHLKGLALRMLRDMLEQFEKTGSTLIMIDSSDKLPDVVKAYAHPFDLSFPDTAELEELVKRTLTRFNREKSIEVAITRKGLDTIVRNLRGLTRRQAERIILDTVCEDRRFDDEDIHVVIASKRQMVQRGELLQYIQTPRDLSEIGGMRRLKKWLRSRSHAFGPEAEAFGLRAPRGVLMLGVQGAGKSLLRQGHRHRVAPATIASGPGHPVQQLHRRIGSEPPRGPAPDRGDEPRGAVDRRDREGFRLGRQPEHRWRALANGCSARC